MLPFFVESRVPSARMFELNDGRFQILDSGIVGAFLAGLGYLLVERELAEFLRENDVERIVLEDAILFDRPTGHEFRTHVRVRVRQ